jgi:hypothetical protein
MATLTQAQIAVYAAAAGAANPQLAAAVAMAESGGNANAHNALPPDDSYGLWQINMRGTLGPDRRKKLGITSNSQLYDPATNARAMVMISSGGTNFTPWSTYTSGAYQKYASPATVGANAQQAGWIDNLNTGLGLINPLIYPLEDLFGGGSGSPLDPFSYLDGAKSAAGAAADAVGWLVKAGKWLSKASNWVRIGYVVGGGTLVIVGLGMLAKDAELGVVAGQAQKVAKKVVAGGKKAGAAAKTGAGKAREAGKKATSR